MQNDHMVPLASVVCPLCGTLLRCTQQLVRLAGRQVHAACLIRPQPMIGPASGA